MQKGSLLTYNDAEEECPNRLPYIHLRQSGTLEQRASTLNVEKTHLFTNEKRKHAKLCSVLGGCP